MRYTKAIVAGGTLRANAFGMRHAVVTSVIVAASIWAGVAFVQEAYIGHRLSQQVGDLRKQNNVLAAQTKYIVPSGSDLVNVLGLDDKAVVPLKQG